MALKLNPDMEALLSACYQKADAAIAARFVEGKREQPYNCGFAWVKIDGTLPLARYCRAVRKELDIERANLAARATAAQDYAEVSRINREYNIKMNRYGDKGEPGWQFWKPGSWPKDAPDNYQQDMDFHMTGARAFVQALAEAGIRADASCRLD